LKPYFIVIENVQTETITKELKEVADHVSATFTDLYFLANSSDLNFNLTKELSIPDSIHNRAYMIEILHNDENLALSIRVAHCRRFDGEIRIGFELLD